MLNKIKILDFKSLGCESLDLKPLTVITGINSSGKSTVIQALLLAIRHSSLENQLKMEMLTKFLDSFSDIRNKYNNAKKIQIELNSDTGILKWNADSEEILTEGPADYRIDVLDNIVSPELFYLNANRQGPEENAQISQSKVGISGQFIFGHFDRVKDEPIPDDMCFYRESKDLDYQVGRWLSYITDTKTELKTEAKSSSEAKVYFQDKDLGPVSPLNLGAGMSYVSKVIILCLIAKKGDLVIIENPEIHLHPQAQAQLGVFFTFIANCGIQLIIETHCEHLINKICYQVYDEKIAESDVVIQYKANVREQFQQLIIDENGQFTDQLNNIISFPTGFFDTSVADLMDMR
ncbi:AAA family ATPase [Moritella sp.]|uniref:AAA family ATPase n=1 Tax=Moritella sp. TaxID=78556 RepID=UPI001D23B548|nr:AAA family ATPase [Moritella sp.]MCJ8349181.1 AAA family ATPase [Moritella sp.]NQZ39469.1 AAA family ATPase [Moritella sp.]